MEIMPIIQPIPQSDLLQTLLESQTQIAAGFPLWLIGGAPHYSDIDIYTNHWGIYYNVFRLLKKLAGLPIQHTPYTVVFQIETIPFQLVQPGCLPCDDITLLSLADLSPSACLLKYTNNQFEVLALYPEDIRQRICRVFSVHDWTDYRINQYRQKGYQIEMCLSTNQS